MYYLVENGPLKWPTKEQHGFEISAEAQDLISKLLEKDKNARLGKVNDVKDVINHPWFASINVDKLLNK
jgi:serine/threonine protein kinase